MQTVVFPSDHDRSQSPELDRVCVMLEQLVDERQKLMSILGNAAYDRPKAETLIGLAEEVVHGLEAQNTLYRDLITERRDQYLREDQDGETDCVTPYDDVLLRTKAECLVVLKGDLQGAIIRTIRSQPYCTEGRHVDTGLGLCMCKLLGESTISRHIQLSSSAAALDGALLEMEVNSVPWAEDGPFSFREEKLIAKMKSRLEARSQRYKDKIGGR